MNDEPGPGGKIVDVGGRNGQGWPPSGGVPDDFPFPLRAPGPAPVMIERPCGPLHGCTFMVIGDEQPVQIPWCVEHDPGYTPPGQTPPEGR